MFLHKYTLKITRRFAPSNNAGKASLFDWHYTHLFHIVFTIFFPPYLSFPWYNSGELITCLHQLTPLIPRRPYEIVFGIQRWIKPCYLSYFSVYWERTPQKLSLTESHFYQVLTFSENPPLICTTVTYSSSISYCWIKTFKKILRTYCSRNSCLTEHGQFCLVQWLFVSIRHLSLTFLSKENSPQR